MILKSSNKNTALQFLQCSIALFALVLLNISLIAEELVTENEVENTLSETETVTETGSEEVIKLAAPTIGVDNPIETQPLAINLAWDPMEEANTYTFQLCSDNNCETVMLFYNNLRDTQVGIPSLNEQQYYWRVSGVDINGVVGEYTTPQPLLVSADFAPAEPETPATPVIEKEPETPWFATYIGPLPWYVWILLLCYLFFMARVAGWFMNKR